MGSTLHLTSVQPTTARAINRSRSRLASCYISSSVALTFAAAQAIAAIAEPQTQEARAAWQWSATDRSIARDAYVQQKQAEDRVQHPSVREPKATILGSVAPELIFPIELFDRLLRISFGAESRDLVRQDVEERSRDAGLALPAAFWTSLETYAAEYLRSKAEVERLSLSLQRAKPRARAALERRIRFEKTSQCSFRAAALADARNLFGANTFDRFLYAAVAPTTFVTVIGQPAESPLALERGCK